MRIQYILVIIILLSVSTVQGANGRKIVVHGEYPVIDELGEGRFFENEVSDNELLIAYDEGKDYKEKAFIAATHFLCANIYGYTFFYQP